MIHGIGVDMASISRVRKVHDRFGERFARRILNQTELLAYRSKNQAKTTQVIYLAKRFAVKEAAAKALGTGEREGVLLKDFSIGHDDLGKPLLEVSGKALQLLGIHGIKNQHVSLSDEQDSIIAFVIFER